MMGLRTLRCRMKGKRKGSGVVNPDIRQVSVKKIHDYGTISC
jgi:hypothetical protein